MRKSAAFRFPIFKDKFLHLFLLIPALFYLCLLSPHGTLAQTSSDEQNIETVYMIDQDTQWEGQTNIRNNGLVVVNSGKTLTVIGKIDNLAGISEYTDSGVTARKLAFLNKGTLNFEHGNDQSYIYIPYSYADGANQEHRIVQTMSGGVTNFNRTVIHLFAQGGTLYGQPLIWALPGAVINFTDTEMEQWGSFIGPYIRTGNNASGGTVNFYGTNTFRNLNSDAGIRNHGTINIKSGTTTFESCTVNLNQQDTGTWIIEDGASLVFDNTTVVPKKASASDAVFQVKNGGTLEFKNGSILDLEQGIGSGIAIKVEKGGTLILSAADMKGGSEANILREDDLSEITITTDWDDMDPDWNPSKKRAGSRKLPGISETDDQRNRIQPQSPQRRFRIHLLCPHHHH